MTAGEIGFEKDAASHFLRAWTFVPAHVKGWFLLAQAVLEEVLHLVSTPAEMLLRRNFGCRALGPFAVLQLAAWAYNAVSLSGRLPGGGPLAGFSVVAFAAAVYHLWETRRHERRAGPAGWRYSYYEGDVLPVWGYLARQLAEYQLRRTAALDRFTVVRFGEPALCLLLAAAVYPLGRPLAVYLAAAGAALAFKGGLSYLRAVNLDRDQKDAQAVGRWLSGTHPAAGAGCDQVFVVHVIAAHPDELSDPLPVPDPSPVAEPAAEVPRVRIGCGNCGRLLTAKAKPVARSAVCPYCRTRQRIPAVEAGHLA